MDWNKDKKLYLRVATTYYKKVDKLLLSGDYHNYLTMWSRQALIDDYGKKCIEDIKKFDGFCNYPSHTNYQETIGKLFNTYKKLNYEPKEGSIENFKAYMNHIFQSQYELGLDYFTILYQKPTQPLPILCLVSRKRGTGKTTILNLSKLIFGDNMTVNKTEDFRSQYNEDWSSELLIGIDEALLDRKEDSERIKNLSTAKTTKSQAKYKQKYPDLNPLFTFAVPGYNMRNSEFNAVLGLEQMHRLDYNIEARKNNLSLWLSSLSSEKYFLDYDVEGNSSFALPLVLKDKDSELFRRACDVLESELVEYRVGTAGGGNQARQPYLEKYDYKISGNLEVADHIHDYGLYVGNHPELSSRQIINLCEKLNDC